MKTSITHLWFVAACSLLFTLAGCSVREQMEDCMQYSLTVKAVDSQGNDLTGSNVLTTVDIYLFNHSGYVRRVPIGTNTDFLFGYTKASAVTLVAWGNLKADSLHLPEMAVGTSLEDAQLLLIQQENEHHLPITDLFYTRQVIEQGAFSATRGVVEKNLTLVLERMAAGMSIRTHQLAGYFGEAPESYRFVVRGTSNALNFLGEPINNTAGYAPFTETREDGDLYAAPFRIFPTKENQQQTEIDIYSGSIRLCTVAEDEAGNPLFALSGQQLNVDIKFGASIQVTVTVVPWDEVNQETEM